MIDITNIKDYAIEGDGEWSFFPYDYQFASLPKEEKDQIYFLNEKANRFLQKYFGIAYAQLDVHFSYENGNHFKYIDYRPLGGDDPTLKKWLYQKGIPFSKWVYVVHESRSQNAIMMTWKMIIKYSDDLFGGQDVAVFDETREWSLVYHHSDELLFGRINVSNPEPGYEEVEAMNERKRKFPKFKHPLRDE